MKPRCLSLAVAFLALAAPRFAAAAENETGEATPSIVSRVQSATQAGLFLPLALTPSVGPNRAAAAGFGGYDSAAQGPRVESFADARIYGPIALRFGAAWRDSRETMAPSIMGRVQLLSQQNHGIDGAVSLAYKAEGFNEPEGELELVLSVARTLGAWRLIGNLAYGQDGEGEERDGEVRAAALCRLGTLFYLGLDGRGRFDLGSERARLRANNEAKYDLDVGPVLNLALGPLMLGAHAGLSANQHIDADARVGFVAMAGLGTAL